LKRIISNILHHIQKLFKDHMLLKIFIFPAHEMRVYEDEYVLKSFKLMRKKGASKLLVIEKEGHRLIGNAILRDVQFGNLFLCPLRYIKTLGKALH
jgi:hypothetical protein